VRKARGMISQDGAADARRTSIHWNRWSVFFSLAGLVLLAPAFVVPSMLVANALDGAHIFSVVTGIRELWRNGHAFLAWLILIFSVVFPVVKLLVSLLCASGPSWLPRRARTLLVRAASWTAKYSMLDVLVVAMIVLLVKVGDYVKTMPCRGIYLFTAAVICSGIAGAMLERGLKLEGADAPIHRPRWRRHLLMLLAGAGLAWWCWKRLEVESGGRIDRIVMTRLTERGQLKRSIEKTFALQEITKQGHEFFSEDTWTRMREAWQTMNTDAGWSKPEAFLILKRRDGSTVETARIKEVNFDDEKIALTFAMPHEVFWNDLDSMKLMSNVVYTRFLNNTVMEEEVRADTETYSMWQRQWHGRIFTFALDGPRGSGFWPGLIGGLAALLTAFWGAGGLLAGSRRK
jgi:paraquat-inducible protein A